MATTVRHGQFLLATLSVITMGFFPHSYAGAQAAGCPEAAISADIAVDDGRLYTQASGYPGRGFAVTDEEGISFWSEFQRLGGVEGVGYPVSQRFVWDGFVTQAFQKMVFQWRPEAGQVYAVNVLDLMHERGLDEWLRVHRATPAISDWAADAGRTWPEIVAAHQALLTDPDIRDAYYAVSNPMALYGLPMAPITDMGEILVLRMQRGIIQKWLVDTPWSAAGQVTIANSGDIAKEAELLPAGSLAAESIPHESAIPAEAPFRITAIGDAAASSPQQIQFLASRSPVIVVGTVREVGQPRWNTPDGRRPANPHLWGPFGVCSDIFHLVTLDVNSNLKGSEGLPVIAIQRRGGTIGQDFVEIRPRVDLQPGAQVIAFLRPSAGGVHSILSVRYLVRGDTVIDAFDSSWSMPYSDFVALVSNAGDGTNR